MSLWNDDAELFEIARRELFSAVVGDIMDQMELQNQFLPPRVRPLRDDMMVIGRAMPVLTGDVYGGDGQANPLLSQPFGLMLEALDDLKRNEVYVVAGASSDYALWGELMSVRARQLGAVGAVMNGYSRDTHDILSMGFPVFSFGPYAQDQAPRGKVMDFRVPIKMGAVHIHPGDIILGDVDGVCVVPQAAEVDVMAKALEKARGEKLVREAIENGMSAVEAFRTYGIM